MCKCFRNEQSMQQQRGSITSACRRQQGNMRVDPCREAPAELLQDRIGLPGSRAAVVLRGEISSDPTGQGHAGTESTSSWGASRCGRSAAASPTEAGARPAALHRHPARLGGRHSPAVSWDVMNSTLLLLLALSESTELHQSFRRCFIPLKKRRIKDVVGTRLIR